MEIISNICTAETIKVEHPESSYAIFCFNSIGDLFVSSDWGFYTYTWRAYNGTFKEFLAQCNKEYIVGKLGMCYTEMVRKRLPKERIKHLENLVEGLIKHCKDDKQ